VCSNHTRNHRNFEQRHNLSSCQKIEVETGKTQAENVILFIF